LDKILAKLLSPTCFDDTVSDVRIAEVFQDWSVRNHHATSVDLAGRVAHATSLNLLAYIRENAQLKSMQYSVHCPHSVCFNRLEDVI